MPTISEPINPEDLPTSVETLHEYIITLAYVKNAVIETRDTHVASLLCKVIWLEGRMQWYKERCAAAEAATAFYAPAAAATRSGGGRAVSPRPHTPAAFRTPSPSPDYGATVLPSVEEDEGGSKERTSPPARSTRSRTSGASRVSKKGQKRGRGEGGGLSKVIKRG